MPSPSPRQTSVSHQSRITNAQLNRISSIAFERMDNSFKASHGNTEENAKPLHKSRIKHIVVIYVVEVAEGQIYIGRQLHNCAHYQTPQEAAKYFRRAKRAGIYIVHIRRDEHFSSDFLTVINQFTPQYTPKIAALVDALEHEELVDDLVMASKGKRGTRDINKGLTGSQSVRPDPNSLVQAPCNTNMDAAAAKRLVILTQLFREFIKDRNAFSNEERKRRFSQRIVDEQGVQGENVFESITYAMLTAYSRLMSHYDWLNDPDPNFDYVICCTKVYLDCDGSPRRIAQIAYSRKACSDYLHRFSGQTQFYNNVVVPWLASRGGLNAFCQQSLPLLSDKFEPYANLMRHAHARFFLTLEQRIQLLLPLAHPWCDATRCCALVASWDHDDPDWGFRREAPLTLRILLALWAIHPGELDQVQLEVAERQAVMEHVIALANDRNPSAPHENVFLEAVLVEWPGSYLGVEKVLSVAALCGMIPHDFFKVHVRKQALAILRGHAFKDSGRSVAGYMERKLKRSRETVHHMICEMFRPNHQREEVTDLTL